MKLTLSVDNLSTIKWWVDASDNTHADCKGHTGAMMSLSQGKGATVSIPKKHPVNTKSSTESEIVGAVEISTISTFHKLSMLHTSHIWYNIHNTKVEKWSEVPVSPLGYQMEEDACLRKVPDLFCTILAWIPCIFLLFLSVFQIAEKNSKGSHKHSQDSTLTANTDEIITFALN